MARPYSLDLRERVVASVGSGKSCRMVATLFHVSVASVVKWSQRARRTGTAAAKGRQASLRAGRPAGLAARPIGREARSDIACHAGRAAPARHHRGSRQFVAVPAPRGH